MSVAQTPESRLLSEAQRRSDMARQHAEAAIDLLEDGLYSNAAAEAHRAHQQDLISKALLAEAAHIEAGAN